MAARKKDTSDALFATAIQVIEKATKKRPIRAVFTQMPHAPSGSSIIDHLIGGKLGMDGKPMCPGYPRGKITEIFGEETSGKTTAALQAIAEAQKRGEKCMFLDFEKALHFPYAKSLGVDFDQNKLICYEPDSFEQGLQMLFVGIKAGVGVLVVDSVASMVPASELEKSLDKAAQIGILPQKMAQNLPKMVNWLNNPPEGNPGTALLLLNQTRAVINTGPGAGRGPEKNTSGGKALKFYAALRLLFKKKKSAYIERVDPFTGEKKQSPYGAQTEVRIIKSKVDAKEGRTADIFIRYGEGIDEALTLIESGVNHKFIKHDKATYICDGKSFRGREQFRNALLTDSKMLAGLREKILARVREQQVSPKDATPEELVLEEAKESDDEDEMASLFDEVKQEVLTEEEAGEEAGESAAEPN